MSNGIPLNDGDRAPWLAALRELLEKRSPLVLACSALKRSYVPRPSSNSLTHSVMYCAVAA